MDWTQIILGLLGVFSTAGLWAYMQTRARLAREDRKELSVERATMVKEWQEMLDRAQKERSAIITERISDRHLWQEQIATIEQDLQKTRAELSLTTSAYKEIRNELHKTQNELKTALAQLEAIRLENVRLKKERDEWQIERDELHVRVRHLERIIDKEGLDTGPLDQGTKK